MQFAKTKMCKFEILGICTKGTQCPFAHAATEINPLPDLSRTKLCKQLLQTGTCDNPGCTYAHRKDELRGVYKTKMCRFFAENGHCALGARCSFAHSDGEVRPALAPSPAASPATSAATLPPPPAADAASSNSGEIVPRAAQQLPEPPAQPQLQPQAQHVLQPQMQRGCNEQHAQHHHQSYAPQLEPESEQALLLQRPQTLLERCQPRASAAAAPSRPVHPPCPYFPSAASSSIDAFPPPPAGYPGPRGLRPPGPPPGLEEASLLSNPAYVAIEEDSTRIVFGSLVIDQRDDQLKIRRSGSRPQDPCMWPIRPVRTSETTLCSLSDLQF